MSVIVLTPSRGTMHSRTTEAVMSNLFSTDIEFVDWVFTHDKPIPDAHEYLAEQAVESGADFAWFIEEDVVPPPDALRRSLELIRSGAAHIAAVDYPVGNPQDAWGCTVSDENGNVQWCGTGCTLVPTAVLDALPRPWFSTQYEWVSHQGMYGPWIKRERSRDNAKTYGHQDIYFSMQAREHGFRIGKVPGMLAGHAMVLATGSPGSNVGTHTVFVRDRIVHQWPGEKA